MAEYIIKNESLTAKFDSFGAELKNVKSTGGKEYIWYGDEKIWSGTAPVLFPICGGLKDDKYTYNGKEYTLPKHGFARKSEFIAETVKSDEIVFLLTESEETLKLYPFYFQLRIKYKLIKNSLRVEYSVNNTSSDTMYFSIGAHEAYLCPEGIEEYSVEFEKAENLDSWVLDGNMLNNKTVRIAENTRFLPLKYEYFDIDALVFKHLNSNKVLLKNNTNTITVEFDGFDYFLLWTKPKANAPYMCIEPWCGIPNSVDSTYELSEKEGIISLESDKEITKIHTITFA